MDPKALRGEITIGYIYLYTFKTLSMTLTVMFVALYNNLFNS
jgi:hypothetical protein